MIQKTAVGPEICNDTNVVLDQDSRTDHQSDGFKHLGKEHTQRSDL